MVELRRLAEEAIKEPTRRPRLPVLEDMQVLIHELQTHQVELEMQNDELRRAEHELQASHTEWVAEQCRYEMLFAALGAYLVTGRIQEANEAACRLLGPQRQGLLGAALPLLFAERDFPEVKELLTDTSWRSWRATEARALGRALLCFGRLRVRPSVEKRSSATLKRES